MGTHAGKAREGSSRSQMQGKNNKEDQREGRNRCHDCKHTWDKSPCSDPTQEVAAEPAVRANFTVTLNGT